MAIRTAKLACLWPGLPQLWVRGTWSALALAVGFTAILNLVLAATLIWTEWLDGKTLLACWAGLGVLWVASTVVSLRGTGAEADLAEMPGDLMPQAQECYLKANWLEAERLLNRMIGRNARDVDARLMLATLQRHTGRLDEAAQQLERLARLDDAAKWEQEIEAERRLLTEAHLPADDDALQVEEAESTDQAEPDDPAAGP